MTKRFAFQTEPSPENARRIAWLARACLLAEVQTWPKPGLVSHIDQGSHTDMTIAQFVSSAHAIAPFFAQLYEAGSISAPMSRLREIGLAAERAMMDATGGINTHRGAIWALGLASAAAGRRATLGVPSTCSDILRQHWGTEILGTPPEEATHGGRMRRLHGAGGARIEAGWGFPTIRTVGVSALRQGRALRPGDPEAARVQCCMALIATLIDTNLLYRGGWKGLHFAQRHARHFLKNGGVGQEAWRQKAAVIHHDFVKHRLSPGGAADGLALSLFLDRLDPAPPRQEASRIADRINIQELDNGANSSDFSRPDLWCDDCGILRR